MKQYVFVPKKVCSSRFQFELDDKKVVHNVRFTGGCPGNSLGVSKLVEGRPAEEVVKTLRGIDCGGRGTSCPDQLAKALEEVLNK